MQFRKTFRQLLPLTFCLLLAFRAEAGSIQFGVSIDTSSIAGQAGQLDLQFNPGAAGAADALLTVSNFSTDAALGGAINDGGASGFLPGAVDIANSGVINATLQDIVYNTSISFDIELTGVAVDTPLNNGIASDFFVFLWDDDPFFPAPLLSDALFGEVLGISLLDDGSTAVSTYDADAFGTPSVVTVNPITAASVPLPPSFYLVLIGGVLLFAKRKGLFRS